MQVRIILAYPEDQAPAHGIQRLDDDIAVRVQKILEQLQVPADPHRNAAVCEPRGIELLVRVSYGSRPVDHQHAIGLGAFQQIGGI